MRESRTYAILRWLVPVSKGGLVRGKKFIRPARFEHQDDKWTNNAWSLVVNVIGVPSSDGRQAATIKFLVSDAPKYWLQVGTKFILYEGDLELAEGRIDHIE